MGDVSGAGLGSGELSWARRMGDVSGAAKSDHSVEGSASRRLLVALGFPPMGDVSGAARDGVVCSEGVVWCGMVVV